MTLESEDETEEDEKEGECVSEEEEFEISFEDETVEQVEREEFLGDFSNANNERFVLYR